MATISIRASPSPSQPPPPPPPPSTPSVITPTFTEQKWRNHTRENVKLDLDSIIQTLLCAVQVPDHLRQTKPEAYTPQLIALGPFHHFRPELYQIEPLKLATAKRALQRFNLSGVNGLEGFVSEVGRGSGLLPRIQAYYGRHLDVEDETLAWIVAIDVLFLVEVLHNEEILISSFAPCFFDSLKRKLSPHAIFGDLILLENQVPLFLIADLIQQLAAAKDGGDDNNSIDVGDELSRRLDVICHLLSPLQLPEGRFPTYFRRRHLLDRLYLLITRGEHEAAAGAGGGGGGNSSSSNSNVRAPTSVGILQRIASGLLKKVEDARNSYYGGAVVTDGEKDAVAGSILARVLKKEGGGDQDDDDDGSSLVFAKAARARMERGNQRSFIGVDEERENFLVRVLQNVTSLEIGPDENVANDFQTFAQEQGKMPMTGIFQVFTMINKALEDDRCIIPSACQLKKVNIKVTQLTSPTTAGRTAGSLCSTRFDPKSKTLHLPTFTWNPNSEVVMRNLVAYEATAKSSSLVLTRYTELMHGLVRTAEDVQELRKEGVVIAAAVDDATLVEMFGGMGLSSSYPKGSTILDGSVAAINQYYNKQLKILLMRLFKKYAKVTVKYLVVVAGLLLVMVLFIQAWCSVYRCPGAVHSRVVHNVVG
ncbi:unnamed protein product, partial [Linum tenue]